LAVTAEDLEDLFRPLGHVTIRRFFSGRGIMLDGVVFAFEIRGEVFLKADGNGAAALAAVGSRPFTYNRAGREVSVGFWTLPESAHEDPDELRRWALPALEFARRRKAAKPKKLRKPQAVKATPKRPLRA
jgi:DNA transformation protein